MEKTKLQISEAGNGWPGVGDFVWDTSTGIIYRIVNDGENIESHGPGYNNTCIMIGEFAGTIDGVNDEEYASIESHGCGARVIA